eukprot:CAMPEP_0168470620 /NCGR_PEP_ID=MMETSP0228-20121227/58827_1 /TAXON_ID=133427 /ORGANISM="Protoceratium reticulatum, Strain CCCM 535 (=CCMP 1889)" /LENGTH=120 /DNA_ID=CAMNT_0008486437 /DNA_START=487 /DNA_END=846 /DNA_ORIENTATION=+
MAGIVVVQRGVAQLGVARLDVVWLGVTRLSVDRLGVVLLGLVVALLRGVLRRGERHLPDHHVEVLLQRVDLGGRNVLHKGERVVQFGGELAHPEVDEPSPEGEPRSHREAVAVDVHVRAE